MHCWGKVSLKMRIYIYIYISDKKDFIESLLNHKECLAKYMQHECRDYAYISFVAAHICDRWGNLKEAFELISLSLFIKPDEDIRQYHKIIKDKYIDSIGHSHTALYHREMALESKECWDFESAIMHYELSISCGDEFLLEFLDFLAQIGSITLLEEKLRIYKELEITDTYKYLLFYLDFRVRNNFTLNKEFFKTHKDISAYNEDMELVATYIISTLEVSMSDIDLIRFYQHIFTKNRIRTQFIITRILKIIKPPIAPSYITLNLYADILYLGKIGDKTQNGARLYVNRIYKVKSSPITQIRNKPKVAIALWGIYRANSNKTLELIRDNIAKPLNADVFLHLWNHWDIWVGYGGDTHWVGRFIPYSKIHLFPQEISHYKSMQTYFPNVLRKIATPKSLPLPKEDIKRIINPKIFCVESHEDFVNSLDFDIDKLYFNPNSNYALYSVARMRYSMYKSFELCKNYDDYDYVILARIDQGYMNVFHAEELQDINDNEILCRVLRHGIDNRIMASNMKTMEIFVSKKYKTMLEKQQIVLLEHKLCGEEGMDFMWFADNNIGAIYMNRDIDIMLPTYGMVPNFYEELLQDLEHDAREFKSRDDYKNLLDILKIDRDMLISTPGPNVKINWLKRTYRKIKKRVKRMMNN